MGKNYRRPKFLAQDNRENLIWIKVAHDDPEVSSCEHGSLSSNFIKEEEFLDSETISFSRRVLLHTVIP
jgi:hypothetical protein